MTAAPAGITLTGFEEVREALRHRHLRQALYDEGAVVMADALITLHGEAHRDRRRLENRLFRRDTFARWEEELLGPTIDAALAPFIAAGRGDLLPIGYRTTMALTAYVAGVDHTPDQTDDLLAIVRKLSEGATLVHSTRDREEVRAEVRAAMDRFDAQFLRASVARRRSDPQPDVLSLLLSTDLPDEVIRREVCFYLQAGSHSTANAFTFTVHEAFGAFPDGPSPDPRFLQRCVHETLRLHPASPVAWRMPTEDVVLRSGRALPAGELVVLDLRSANRDPAVWGDEADRFDPLRAAPPRIPPWGHSFGGGGHACIGAELDGGTEDGTLLGTVARMVAAFVAAGGRPDPEHPPVRDTTTERLVFSSYPVVFGQPSSSA